MPYSGCVIAYVRNLEHASRGSYAAILMFMWPVLLSKLKEYKKGKLKKGFFSHSESMCGTCFLLMRPSSGIKFETLGFCRDCQFFQQFLVLVYCVEIILLHLLIKKLQNGEKLRYFSNRKSRLGKLGLYESR
jgi:hypothetical protein